MVKSLSAARLNEIGADQTSLPWASVTFAMPEKASALSVDMSIVMSATKLEPLTAKCDDLISRDKLQCRLENWMRSWMPPRETCAFCRSTVFERDTGGAVDEFVS